LYYFDTTQGPEDVEYERSDPEVRYDSAGNITHLYLIKDGIVFLHMTAKGKLTEALPPEGEGIILRFYTPDGMYTELQWDDCYIVSDKPLEQSTEEQIVDDSSSSGGRVVESPQLDGLYGTRGTGDTISQ